MAEIVVSGTTFEIKGDTPTPQEQLAIDTYLGARNLKDEQTGISEIDEGRIFIKPEDVLSEAQKGKYNKDTESFLASPTFKRIVTEVGLSIAGGIAGAALAPFSGGSSLALTATAAARVARLARPLLNISANTVGKIGRATVGAAAGGGSGAAIAQAFDPREDIVKEVARGAFQGGFGEVLGFGMAGALGKVYNKIAGTKIQTIKGGRAAAQTILRQKAYYNLLDKASRGEPVTDKLIADTQAKLMSKLTDEEIKILKNPAAATERANFLKAERGEDFFKRVEEGSLTPALITENNMIDTLEGVIGASFFGGGKMISAAQGSRLGLLGRMDEFQLNVIKGIDQDLLDPAILGTQIQQAVTGSQKMYNKILDVGYKRLNPAIAKATEQVVNGRVVPRPGYGIDIAFKGRKPVINTRTGEIEQADSIVSYLLKKESELKQLAQRSNVEDALRLIDDLKTLPRNITFGRLNAEYSTLAAANRGSPAYNTVQTEIVKRMRAALDQANIPTGLREEYTKLINLRKMGHTMFNTGIFNRIANYQPGQKAILDQILVKGKKDVAEDFFKKFDMTDTGIVAGQKGAGKRFIPEAEAERLKDGIRGQFFKKFLDNSTELKDQYIYLRADKARNFVEKDFADFINDKTFIKPAQAENLKELVSALKFADGAISAPGVKAGRGKIFIQLKEAGALTQIGSVALGAQGIIDPGTATAFVVAPWALSRVFTSPKLMNLIINGVQGKPRNFEQFSRLMNQLGTGLAGQGLISEEQNKLVQDNIKLNKENYDKIFSGKVPNMQFMSNIDLEDEAPNEAPPIQIDTRPEARPQQQTAQTSMPLPNVAPSNLPLTGGGQGQDRLQLAQTLNLFGR